MRLNQLIPAVCLLTLVACGGSDNPNGSSDAGTQSDAGTHSDAGTDAGTSSCSVVGTFTATTSSGGAVTLAVSGTAASGTFTLHIVTSTTTIDITGSDSVSGDDMTLTNATSAPASVQGCIGQAAVYATVWNAGCTAVTLHKISDACTGRVADADGQTLTRQ